MKGRATRARASYQQDHVAPATATHRLLLVALKEIKYSYLTRGCLADLMNSIRLVE